MKKRGFTLVEMLVAMAVVSILAALSIPSYLYFARRAHYSAIVQMSERYKVGVAACVSRTGGNMIKCNAGSNEIPAAITSPVGEVQSADVVNGIITITPVGGSNGIETTDTYVLTPIYSDNNVSWDVSGGACAKSLATCSSTESE